MITLSTFLSAIVINLYFRGDKKGKVPRWLKKVNGFAGLFNTNEGRNFTYIYILNVTSLP